MKRLALAVLAVLAVSSQLALAGKVRVGGATAYLWHSPNRSTAVYVHQKSVNKRGIATVISDHRGVGSAWVSIARVQATGKNKRVLDERDIGAEAVRLASDRLGVPVALGSAVSNARTVTRGGNIRVSIPGTLQQPP